MKKLHPKRKRRVASGQIRHTHATAAALEDALAVQWDIINRLADALLFAQQRAQRAVEILQEARQSPHSYDADRPSGRRFIYKKR